MEFPKFLTGLPTVRVKAGSTLIVVLNTGCVHAETQGKIKHNNTGSPSRSLGRVNQGHFVAW
jgi:hypothetical protein